MIAPVRIRAIRSRAKKFVLRAGPDATVRFTTVHPLVLLAIMVVSV